MWQADTVESGRVHIPLNLKVTYEMLKVVHVYFSNKFSLDTKGRVGGRINIIKCSGET